MAQRTSESGDHGGGAVTPLASEIRDSCGASDRRPLRGGAISAFDASGFRFDCCERGSSIHRWIEYVQARRMDRSAQMVVAAARQGRLIRGSRSRGAGTSRCLGCDRDGRQKSFEDCCER